MSKYKIEIAYKKIKITWMVSNSHNSDPFLSVYAVMGCI